MVTARWQIQQINQLQKNVNESMGLIDMTNYFSSDTAVKDALIDSINTAARAIANLTTNTYKDSVLTTQISVEEEIAERE